MKQVRVLLIGALLLLCSCETEQGKLERQQAEKREAFARRLSELADIDPGGFRDAKWGMSVKQVDSVLKKKSKGGLIDFSFFAGKGAYARPEMVGDALSSVLFFFGPVGLLAV